MMAAHRTIDWYHFQGVEPELANICTCNHALHQPHTDTMLESIITHGEGQGGRGLGDGFGEGWECWTC